MFLLLQGVGVSNILPAFFTVACEKENAAQIGPWPRETIDEERRRPSEKDDRELH